MLIGTVETTILVLFTIVVFGPVLAERLHIPGIVGLIAGGMLFGPFVIGWLEADGLVADLGAIGIPYLMFLAGLSFDIRAFNDNRRSAIVYGLLGFIVPFVLSLVVALAFFDLGLLGSALICAMWVSNTLVAYPEVQAAGLHHNRAVSAAVSAGVVADGAQLLVDDAISSVSARGLDAEGIVRVDDRSRRARSISWRNTTSHSSSSRGAGRVSRPTTCSATTLTASARLVRS